MVCGGNTIVIIQLIIEMADLEITRPTVITANTNHLQCGPQPTTQNTPAAARHVRTPKDNRYAGNACRLNLDIAAAID
jgi:hypothetical protein